MNRGKGKVTSRLGGYTIVETLIFLAVSAAIFFAAMQLIGGQQGKAQFVDAVRDFETKLTDIANDVSTGYYQGDGSFNCYDSGGGVLKFDGAPKGQGTNEPCIFVGTVIKFGDGNSGSDDDRSKFTQFTMAGLRSDSSGVNTTSLVNAKPQVVDAPSTYTAQTLSYGASVQCVGLGSSCVWNSPLYGALGFFTKFVGTDPSGGNGIQTDVLPYMAVPLNATGQSQMNNISYPTSNYTTGLNPNGGITICLKSGTSPQYALVHVGGSGNNLTFSNEIKNYSGVIPCN